MHTTVLILLHVFGGFVLFRFVFLTATETRQNMSSEKGLSQPITSFYISKIHPGRITLFLSEQNTLRDTFRALGFLTVVLSGSYHDNASKMNYFKWVIYRVQMLFLYTQC